MQVLYAFIAMLLLALLSLTLNRGTHSAERRKVVNEVVTQLTGVGVEVLEHIGRKPFDAATDSTLYPPPPPFPLVRSAIELTPEAGFGGCLDFSLCADMDDFDGLSFDRTAEGFRFNVTVDVVYVNETTPDVVSGTQTFSKEVRLTISNPYLYFYDKSNPLTVQMARVFSYDKATDD